MTEHQQAVDAAARKVLDYLKEHNPELVELLRENAVEKDMTAGDVHQATALGNQKKSKKMSFAEALADGKKPKVVPDSGPAEVPPMEKADWTLPLQILKAEPDQQMIFGWASVATQDGQIVVDKQGDMILPEDLEKAAYEFVLYCRAGGDMHKQNDDGTLVQKSRLVESMVFTKQKQDILKIDLGIEGWWVGFKVDDADVWAAHRRGERPEFSIGGRGRRVPV